MDCEERIEEVGEADALGFGDQAEESAVGVEGPRAGLSAGFEAGFVAPVQDLGGNRIRESPVGDLHGL